tara:strand:+ start:253 stop:726 length:474 start_codon:yes stop_codon:yes gene_type:complete
MRLVRSIPVNIIAFLADIISMHVLGEYLDFNLIQQVYISSLIRINILFIGHIKYTFRDIYITVEPNQIKKTAIKFYPWEIFSMIITNHLVSYISNMIDSYIKTMNITTLNNQWFTKYTLLKKGGHYKLNTTMNIIIKQLVILIFYIIIDLKVYKHIF